LIQLSCHCLASGVGAALRLAMSKGYLEKEESNRPSNSRFAHLQAKNYSIEDKAYGDDDKYSRRDRYSGPLSDFREKETFKPNVKLEYIDDNGHLLSAKEAFRYLSHKFHGKGPGKNKIEKRLKKNEQEGVS
jgi:U4/U6.U5 tri-snRNP-associated protein 1